MDLAARKYSFIQEIETVDENIFDKLEKLLNLTKNDWVNKLSTEEQIEIVIGEQQADKNEFISHEKVMNKFKKWHS